MKKRSFLLPLATSIAALVAAGGTSGATTTVPSTTVPAIEAPTVAVSVTPKPLVIQRARDMKMAQYGHSSHASHASHRSHYSSR